MATEKLIILYTNDLHSFFEQMPKISTAMKQLRQQHEPEEVLMIDCGDHMDRMRMETEGSDGIANIEIMNQTGYEAAVFGNNEGLTFTPSILSEIYSQHAEFTLIGSNFYDAARGEIPSWMVPYHIIKKGNLRVGVIGVTINFTRFYELLGWDVRDPLEVTKKLVSELREQVDILIVMSHLGLSKDRQMAEEIEGIDCIFGGHTHHLLEKPIQIGDTFICCAGKFGEYVGELELHYDSTQQLIIHAAGRCINVSPFPNDPEIDLIISKFQRISEQKLSKVCVLLEEPLSIDWNRESPLGNLLAAGIRKQTDADIGVVNAGQILQGLSKGEITLKRLLEICPSPINPCRMSLSGKWIREALEESLLSEFIQLPIRGFGFRGKVLGTLCVDGLDIEYNPAHQSYEKITGIWVNGMPLESDREYIVGTIDMFTFGIGYTTFTEGKEIKYYLPEFIRDVLHKQLLDRPAINSSREMHWVTQ